MEAAARTRARSGGSQGRSIAFLAHSLGPMLGPSRPQHLENVVEGESELHYRFCSSKEAPGKWSETSDVAEMLEHRSTAREWMLLRNALLPATAP
ncbi:unnamed protein product [Lampetra fluviatilis]